MKITAHKTVQVVKTRVQIEDSVKKHLQTTDVIVKYVENVDQDQDEIHIRAVGLDDTSGMSVKGKYNNLPFLAPAGDYYFDREENDFLVFVLRSETDRTEANSQLNPIFSNILGSFGMK